MSKGKTHLYKTSVKWAGATTGTLSTEGLPHIAFGPPVEFGGVGGQWTPEYMLVGAAEACTLLTFLAYAHRRGVKVSSYTSSAEATLGRDEDGVFRFTEITIRLQVRVKEEADVAPAREVIAGLAGKCFVSSSLHREPKVEATVEVGA